jgi:hypothetical protein
MQNEAGSFTAWIRVKKFHDEPIELQVLVAARRAGEPLANQFDS